MMARYHVWFSTKHRRDALQDEVREFVLNTLNEIAQRTVIEIIEIEATFDHVHLLLVLPEGRTLASAMHRLKGASARAVFDHFPELPLDMGSRSFWQKGYGSRLVPDGQVETVRRYIRTQEDRPLRHEDH